MGHGPKGSRAGGSWCSKDGKGQSSGVYSQNGYVKQNQKISDFKVGTTVKYHGKQLSEAFRGMSGTVVSTGTLGRNTVLVDFGQQGEKMIGKRYVPKQLLELPHEKMNHQNGILLKKFNRQFKQTERNNNPKHNAKVAKKKQEKYEKTLVNREKNKEYRMNRSLEREKRKTDMEKMLKMSDPKNPEYSRMDSEISRLNREASLHPEDSDEYKRLKAQSNVISDKSRKMKSGYSRLEFLYTMGMY
mgnify:CR=1 FL=1